MHTLWNQLLLEHSLDLFNTLQLCYRHNEDVHEEVWCRKNIFWQTYRVLYLAIFLWLHLVIDGLIVYTLWIQLLLELSLDLFNTLKIRCRHIEDMHEEGWCRKNIFWQTYRVVNLAIFSTLWCCRHTEDVHGEVWCRKKKNWQTLCGGYQVSGTYCQVSLNLKQINFKSVIVRNNVCESPSS